MSDAPVRMAGKIIGRRPLEWLDAEPVTARERRLAGMSEAAPMRFEKAAAFRARAADEADLEAVPA